MIFSVIVALNLNNASAGNSFHLIVEKLDKIIRLLEEGCETCEPPELGVPKTGQTTCYNVDGNVIDCIGTGQDGDIQAGVAWPNPRFNDNDDGTVTDNLTGLMWTKNSQQVAGERNWYDAITAYNDLNFAGYNDWRLPNVNELLSLIDRERLGPALPLGHPFVTVPAARHNWTSTTYIGANGEYA